MSASGWESPVQVLLVMVLVVLGGYVAIRLLRGLFWAVGEVFAAIGRGFRHVGAFVVGTVRDTLGFLGSLITAVAYLPPLALSVVFMRRSGAAHYAAAIRAEVVRGAGCLYRAVLGNFLRLLCLDALTEGLERRVPEVIARAPGPDRPSSGPAAFAGYRITGALAGGGSGARLHLAEPDAEKLAQWRRSAPRGAELPLRVVIKSFSLGDGSTLPQIVRENRALAAARDLGLVLEHELTATRFHYVMPYVPGEDLTAETARLHAASGSAGLDERSLRRALALTDDLLSTLQRFHKGGLWHKDVKPGNVIVSDGRAHLVDFGLITPLASAMTLTTHGTEYFRDPEMVRLALKGAKVHEVDGIKFDVYGAGAVLYSLIEGSFPAHGSLSRLTRRCPEALRWIIRRAMADMQHRYTSATEMLADLRAVSTAADPHAVRPADLPSVAALPGGAAALDEPEDAALASRALAGSPSALRAPASTSSASTHLARGAAAHGEAASIPLTRSPQADGSSAAGYPLRPLDPPYGRRRYSRLSVAAALFGLFIAYQVLTPATSVHELHATPHADRPVVSSVDDGAPPAPRGRAARSSEAVPAGASIEMLEPVSLQTLGAATHTAAPLPQPPAGLVLVLDDLPANAAPERLAAVAALCARLREARYALLGGDSAGLGAGPSAPATAGLGPAAPAADGALVVTGINPLAEVELLAGARAAAGLSDPSDPDAVRRISEFLREQGDALDAILWIGRAGDEAPVQTRVFARDDAAASALGRLLDGRRDG